ncbi:ribonuclease E inhibitor RraB [Novipirellula sp.]|uniref:ribonuclease E inhibitor RraB n=1 Tax=Novipirellula sp. TaxID=2795430 RepID=UPI0035690D53
MSHDFPNDENGNVLHSLIKRGDLLTSPREINFHFVFPSRSLAVGFIEIVTDKLFRLELSWSDDHEQWQVTVVQYMVPDHSTITALESRLMDQAHPLEGTADGWGCFAVKP